MTEDKSYLTLAISALMRWLLVVAVAWVACAGECRAAANPFGISDNLYSLYVSAYRIRTEPEGLKVARELHDKALAEGDHKAVCVALTLPMSYYYYHRDDSEFYRAVKRLQDVASKYGYEHYFYYAFSNKVNYLLNKGDFKQARYYVSEMEKQARDRHHDYGLYVCVTSLAQVYLSTREVGMAIENLNQALHLIDALSLDVSKADVYIKLAACYEDFYDYENMLACGHKALATCRTPMQESRALYPVCYALIMLGRDWEFDNYYNRYVALRKGITPDSHEFEEQTIAILKMMRDADYALAYKYIMKKNRMLSQLRLLAEYYRRRYDYKSMAEVQTRLYRQQIALADNVLAENYDDAYARIFNLQLNMQNLTLQHTRNMLASERQAAELRNANLQLANSQLTLRNSSLELSRTKSESDRLRLSYSRKQLEAARLKGNIVATQSQSQFNDMISVLGFIVGGLVLVSIFFYLKTRATIMADLKDTNAVLERSNQELILAKDHAEAANNVKTTFFNNMSEDIRQPLETIAHLSTLIANAGKDASKEQLRTLSRQLGDKTGELLHIVDNVLKKT